MKITPNIITVTLSFLIFLSCSRCHKSRIEPNPQFVKASLVLKEKAYALGSNVLLTLVVKNSGKSPVKLTFPTACRVDFIVEKDGSSLWSALDGKMCAQMLGYAQLAVGDSVVFDGFWEGKTSDGKPMGLGRYEARGLLLTNPPLETEPVVFYLVD